MKYTAAEAGRKLSRLVEQACAGKDVVISSGKELLVRLVPVRNPRVRKDRVPGALKGKIFCRPGAFDPLTDQELSDLGFE